MGLSHKNFYGGRARIYKQYVARGNANCIGDLTLANFVNFQKNFFSKKDVKFSFWRKGSEIFFPQSIQFFLLKSELYSGRRKYKSLEAKMRGSN